MPTPVPLVGTMTSAMQAGTPSSDAVAVSLRILEIVALLLPVVAITVQLLAREYDSETGNRSYAEKALFLVTAFVFFVLVLVAANLITVIDQSLGNETVSTALTNLSTAYAMLTVALLLFLYDFYRDTTGGNGESESRPRLRQSRVGDTPNKPRYEDRARRTEDDVE